MFHVFGHDNASIALGYGPQYLGTELVEAEAIARASALADNGRFDRVTVEVETGSYTNPDYTVVFSTTCPHGNRTNTACVTCDTGN